MIFQNPWAWIGLLAIALPVAAHLYARRPARRQPFPHLRFLPAAALKPIQRDRVTDLLLLLLRCAILAAAVAALTRPLSLTADRARDLGDQIARAIVVDTSASMQRTAASGGLAVDAARREAARQAQTATSSRIGESATPARLVAGAVAWLATQPRRRELVVISDFQVGALTRADLAGVPAETGITTIAIEIAKNDSGAKDDSGNGFRESIPGVVVGVPGSSRGQPLEPTPAPSPLAELVLLTASQDQDAALAARSAAVERGAPASPAPSRPIAILYPGFEDRDGIQQSERPIDQPWMLDVLSNVVNDPDVVDAFARAGRRASESVTALRATVNANSLELLVPRATPGSLESAAVISAALRASANNTPAAELALTTIPQDERLAWHREPGSTAPTVAQVADEASAGRWLWVAALLLLGIEMLVRRRTLRPAEQEVPHARVA